MIEIDAKTVLRPIVVAGDALLDVLAAIEGRLDVKQPPEAIDHKNSLPVLKRKFPRERRSREPSEGALVK